MIIFWGFYRFGWWNFWRDISVDSIIITLFSVGSVGVFSEGIVDVSAWWLFVDDSL